MTSANETKILKVNLGVNGLSKDNIKKRENEISEKLNHLKDLNYVWFFVHLENQGYDIEIFDVV